MNRNQRNQLLQLEHQLLRLRGCMDAMMMIDEGPTRDPRKYRDSVSVLHIIMDEDLRNADSYLQSTFAKGASK